mmetsp:Transcript_15625/g.25564  ORF Transcript_15625/g.25564 Transcript_15625/m.25564 type:complete len:197 (+) Transcript_15625:546-1136(+)|eukprot:CAMPEP_0203770142 /NCGR_PEP_ID=MMETSP0099_2-20121227/2617_1 /ASSEMBLY_ACC=CAM_ASM_000209 /TAXON_ID=96639 /ORGANISM=" , Strain NY0313808BC1" /LENGTH=196 /DNA_ID=CAMNT_0050667187 /DNA_START=1594 /DNA_END=2184 /DNA_ORIENTATION=-
MKRLMRRHSNKKKREVRFADKTLVSVIQLPVEEAEYAKAARKGNWKRAPQHDSIWDGKNKRFRDRELTTRELCSILKNKRTIVARYPRCKDSGTEMEQKEEEDISWSTSGPKAEKNKNYATLGTRRVTTDAMYTRSHAARCYQEQQTSQITYPPLRVLVQVSALLLVTLSFQASDVDTSGVVGYSSFIWSFLLLQE